MFFDNFNFVFQFSFEEFSGSFRGIDVKDARNGNFELLDSVPSNLYENRDNTWFRSRSDFNDSPFRKALCLNLFLADQCPCFTPFLLCFNQSQLIRC
ncbi:hypothetical protein TVAG_197040 [Trichomonas vaginalis G3]|uniref:Uncharacterized protein n=1 Tax=Trichomonas vaginalis (strain ATCC PRA-98 / G3) TaxID=412133 RepID=A2EPH4_TRIV3|nr:hypothetical protein TVAGG3_0599650 [Trichomonas vaginalis G3]EAY05403.1 hypothetical protein TVAG_197040 [Trichomonas vaginalis G3]KAI5523843.1 hypothetical protein TVAGG3_0599650 [Trichomonas vaginalis G3]|eukprot:XP_001317626.1 hypothetical protein [Trichomonas vaginalis G3]